MNNPIKDKAEERDDKGKQLSDLKDIEMTQTKNKTQRHGIVPPRDQDQRQFPPWKLSKGARKRAKGATLRDEPERVPKGWKPYHKKLNQRKKCTERKWV